MKRGFFVTGTDTGVGKTIIASGIALSLKKQGGKVGLMKPIQTGVMTREEVPYSQDLEFMKKALSEEGEQSPFPFNAYAPYLLREPLSPYVAAKIEGLEIKPSLIVQSARWLQEQYSFLVVEGAGGALVPISKDYLMIDLIRDLGFPVVLVARATLGTINHTLLTIEALRNRNIPVAGVVLNKATPSVEDMCELTNPEVIQALGQVNLLGIFPYSPDIKMEEGQIGDLEDLAQKHLSAEKLLAILEEGSSTTLRSEVQSSQLKEWDKKYIWHPFTQMQAWCQEDPLVIEGGEGVYLIDSDGHRYLDGVASLWTNVHGHGKKEINEAINDQLTKIAHSTFLGLTHGPGIQLAQRLISIAPDGLSRVFYSDNGATACEIALKMCFQYWHQQGCHEKKRFLYFENSYHGDTLGSVSVGGIDLFHQLYQPLLFRAYRTTSPYCYRCNYHLTPSSCNLRCLDDLELIFQAHSEEIAGLIIEPGVQGAGGMIVLPHGFLKRVRQLCTRYQVLMIADEVAVGFGRTGKMFACQHEDVQPDLLCLAKGITGGYLPLAATLTTEAIYNGFLGDLSEQKTFFHGHTYTGNPLACRAGLANLDIFEREKVIGKLQKKIEFMSERLETLNKLSQVGDIRQKGLLAGIELVKDKATKEPYPPEEKISLMVVQEARKKGVILRPLGNVIVIMPPLSTSLSELDDLISITYEAIAKVV